VAVRNQVERGRISVLLGLSAEEEKGQRLSRSFLARYGPAEARALIRTGDNMCCVDIMQECPKTIDVVELKSVVEGMGKISPPRQPPHQSQSRARWGPWARRHGRGLNRFVSANPEKKRHQPKILVTKREESGYIGSCWRTTPSTAV
jgi:hypothetical protein